MRLKVRFFWGGGWIPVYVGERGGKRSWEVERYHFAPAETSEWSFILRTCIITTVKRLECLSDHLFPF